MICSTLNLYASICLFFFRVLRLTFLFSLSLYRSLSLSLFWSLEKMLRGKKDKNLHILQETDNRDQANQHYRASTTEKLHECWCEEKIQQGRNIDESKYLVFFFLINRIFDSMPPVSTCVFAITIESQCEPALRGNYFLCLSACDASAKFMRWMQESSYSAGIG